MKFKKYIYKDIEKYLTQSNYERILQACDIIVHAKEKGRKVIVAVGSGPNLHEGVTTLIAHLMQKRIIDGVCTSSAVISHEMGGTLEKVKRADGTILGIQPEKLPSFGQVEATILSPEKIDWFREEINLDMDYYNSIIEASGDILIKAAGNMAYPGGFRIEKLSEVILKLSRQHKICFEELVGQGADPMTMIGAGALHNLPVLVSVTQLVGGGRIGLSIGDSIPISERSLKIAKLLDSADVIIESAIALCQEIHDGPFETYTGHGIWADWQDDWTFSLSNKKIIRIDLDSSIEKAWLQERKSNEITEAVKKGLPKAKVTGLPFRMEMSGFARIQGSLPIVSDIGIVWPIIASNVSERMGVDLDFISFSQSTEEGKKMREWIVENIQPVDLKKILDYVKTMTKLKK